MGSEAAGRYAVMSAVLFEAHERSFLQLVKGWPGAPEAWPIATSRRAAVHLAAENPAAPGQQAKKRGQSTGN
jgi:hypothetical protein